MNEATAPALIKEPARRVMPCPEFRPATAAAPSHRPFWLLPLLVLADLALVGLAAWIAFLKSGTMTWLDAIICVAAIALAAALGCAAALLDKFHS